MKFPIIEPHANFHAELSKQRSTQMSTWFLEEVCASFDSSWSDFEAKIVEELAAGSLDQLDLVTWSNKILFAMSKFYQTPASHMHNFCRA